MELRNTNFVKVNSFEVCQAECNPLVIKPIIEQVLKNIFIYFSF